MLAGSFCPISLIGFLRQVSICISDICTCQVYAEALQFRPMDIAPRLSISFCQDVSLSEAPLSCMHSAMARHFLSKGHCEYDNAHLPAVRSFEGRPYCQPSQATLLQSMGLMIGQCLQLLLQLICILTVSSFGQFQDPLPRTLGRVLVPGSPSQACNATSCVKVSKWLRTPRGQSLSDPSPHAALTIVVFGASIVLLATTRANFLLPSVCTWDASTEVPHTNLVTVNDTYSFGLAQATCLSCPIGAIQGTYRPRNHVLCTGGMRCPSGSPKSCHFLQSTNEPLCHMRHHSFFGFTVPQSINCILARLQLNHPMLGGPGR